MELSLALPLLVTGVGFYLLKKLDFFFLIHPLRTACKFINAARDKDSRRALYLALAGTLGVGNIFGVAAGILIGGAGSVFWLFVSSFFSMVIKYAETMLVFSMKSRDGGMAGALCDIFPKRGRGLSIIYTILTILLALFMGSAIQTSAVADVAISSLGINPFVIAFIILIFFASCCVFGVSRITKITEILIPLTTIIYILACLSVILHNFTRLPAVINLIITSAFSPYSICGGGVMVAIKEGFARGILSNEAGVGTSALAHSEARGREPSVAGLFGIAEVFFDTTVLCTLTALTILTSIENFSLFKTPMSLVTAAFTSALGDFGGYILLFCIFSFAYSTIICWYFYGHRCTSLYFPKFRAVYIILFCDCILLSPCLASECLLYVTDVLLLFMAFITLSAIVKESGKIRI